MKVNPKFAFWQSFPAEWSSEIGPTSTLAVPGVREMPVPVAAGTVSEPGYVSWFRWLGSGLRFVAGHAPGAVTPVMCRSVTVSCAWIGLVTVYQKYAVSPGYSSVGVIAVDELLIVLPITKSCVSINFTFPSRDERFSTCDEPTKASAPTTSATAPACTIALVLANRFAFMDSSIGP